MGERERGKEKIKIDGENGARSYFILKFLLNKYGMRAPKMAKWKIYLQDGNCNEINAIVQKQMFRQQFVSNEYVTKRK